MRVAVMVNQLGDIEAVLSHENVDRYIDDRPGSLYGVHVFTLDAGLPDQDDRDLVEEDA